MSEKNSCTNCVFGLLEIVESHAGLLKEVHVKCQWTTPGRRVHDPEEELCASYRKEDLNRLLHGTKLYDFETNEVYVKDTEGWSLMDGTTKKT